MNSVGGVDQKKKKGSETVGSDKFSARSFKDHLVLLSSCMAADSSTTCFSMIDYLAA